ncbi:MAG TPA: transposase [Sedimenticola sp.]|nr:transposase [Sedimenticola sp.]
MARQPRFCLPGQPQHVIQRGNNRDIMFADALDYRFYLDTLADACRRFGCAVHAYVCMTNHVHMLMTPEAGDAISQVMQSLGRRYVQYFNYRYRRTGTLWEGRYRATVIDAEPYLLICHRYIELNPVRAGIVAHPAEYPWSSYGHNGRGQPDALLTEHPLYRSLARDRHARQAAYRALFDARIPETTLAALREATNKAWALGNDRFRSRIETLLNRQAAPKPRGGDRRSKRYRKQLQSDRV